MLAERRKYRNLKIKPASDKKKKNNPGTTLYLNQGFAYDKKLYHLFQLELRYHLIVKKKTT